MNAKTKKKLFNIAVGIAASVVVFFSAYGLVKMNLWIHKCYFHDCPTEVTP